MEALRLAPISFPSPPKGLCEHVLYGLIFFKEPQVFVQCLTSVFHT